MYYLLKQILGLLFFIVLINAVISSTIMSCLRVMHHSIYKLETVGIIEVPLPPRDIKKTISLDVRLIIQGTLPTRYVGQIELAESEQFKGTFREDMDTVKFRVRFPTTKPLPFVEKISVNDNVMCEEDLDVFSYFGPVVTRIKLQYMLQFPFTSQNDSSSSSIDSDEDYSKNFSVNRHCGFSLFSPDSEKIPQTRLDWPWLVAVILRSQSSEKFLCSGTLVTAKHVVVAAHCLSRLPNEKAVNKSLVVTPRIFNNGAKSNTDPLDFREVSKLHLYPSNSNSSSNALIAVFELLQAIPFSSGVKPVCLWRQIPNLSSVLDMNGIVTLWNIIKNESHTSTNPKFIHVTIKSLEQCSHEGQSSPHTICAVTHSDVYMCPDFTGGELIIPQKEVHSSHFRWKLRGVIKYPFDSKVCTSSKYLVFTDIGMYADWFAQKLELSLF